MVHGAGGAGGTFGSPFGDPGRGPFDEPRREVRVINPEPDDDPEH